MSREFTDEELMKMKRDYFANNFDIEDLDGNLVISPEDIPDDWIVNMVGWAYEEEEVLGLE